MRLYLPLYAFCAGMVFLGAVLWLYRVQTGRQRADAVIAAQSVVTDLGRLRRIQKSAPPPTHAAIDGLLLSDAEGALVDAGLPATGRAVRSVQLGVTRNSEGSQRTATMILTGLRVPDLGAWLDAWSRRQGAWTLMECQLTNTAETDAFDVRLVFTTPLLEERP